MREILFRAKQVNNGEWVEGYLFDDGMAEVEHYFVGRIVIEPYKGTACDDWDITGIDFCEVNPETLCQYTGMIDKNGKRIWENDIVSAWSEGKYATGMVKQRIDGLYIIYPAYQHNEFWGLCPDKNRKTNVEVIGNVFDDKHLLADTDYCWEQEKETEDSHGE